MNKHSIIGLLMFLPVLFTSCAKYFAEEEEEADPKTVSTLRVIPRSDDETKLEYPINIYAFNSKGGCVSQQTIESSEDSPSISLTLPKGKYRIVAVSGITKEEYDFPEQPSLTDVIKMKQGNTTKVPLMMGNADVDLKDGATKTNTTNIILNYMVAQLKVTLSDIPKDFSNIEVEIAASYSQLSFSGEYTDGKNSVVASSQSGTDEKWDTDTFYTFAGSEKKTIISIHMTKGGNTETYGYTYNYSIQAKQPYVLAGSYAKSIIVGGNIIAGGWEAPITVDFNFGKDSEEDKPSGDNDGDDNQNSNDVFTVNEIPQQEKIWNNCFVLEVTPNEQENEAEVLLMGIKNATNAQGMEKMNYTEADVAIKKYSINEFINWRIPTEEEAILLKSRYNDNLSYINSLLSAAGGKGLGLDDVRYFCNNTKYTFNFKSNSKISGTGLKSTYYLRPVKTIHVTKK